MVDRGLYEAYGNALDQNAAMAEEALSALMDWAAPLGGADLLEALNRYYPALAARYGARAAAVAVDFYRKAREAYGPEAAYEPQAFQEDAAAYARDPADAVAASATREGLAANLAGLLVERAMGSADATITGNASRDPAHPRWAMVPRPGACGFCVMVSSNGWAYATEKKAARPRHPHCRCRAVADFDVGNPALQGYDPEAMRRAYADARDTVREDAERAWARMKPEERRKYSSKNRSSFDKYLAGRISAEMSRRDRAWLQDPDRASEVTRERGAKPWKKERETARLLASHGIPVRFIRETGKKKVPDAYLGPEASEAWEFKVPEAYGEKTVKNQFKKAVGKGTGRLVISNAANGAEDGLMVAGIWEMLRGGDFPEITEVLYVSTSGLLTRFERKSAGTPPVS